MDDSPMIWVVEVNGFMTDIRTCPRVVQELALEKGLIPSIPGERADDSTEECTMSDTKDKSDTPRFRVGDKVRVKTGVIDPDFPDIPLGGWTGTVTEVEQKEDQIT